MSYCEIIPVGRWIQPSSSSGLVESPKGKTPFQSILVHGSLMEKMAVGFFTGLKRIYPYAYIE